MLTIPVGYIPILISLADQRKVSRLFLAGKRGDKLSARRQVIGQSGQLPKQSLGPQPGRSGMVSTRKYALLAFGNLVREDPPKKERKMRVQPKICHMGGRGSRLPFSTDSYFHILVFVFVS